MTLLRGQPRSRLAVPGAPKLGTIGYLAIFVWSVVVVTTASSRLLPWMAGLCLIVAVLCYPRSFWRVVRPRTLTMIALLALPPIFLLGDLDRSVAGIRYSSEGLFSGLQIATRIVVVLIAVDGLTSSVEISSLAGLLERIGLHGLGFSIGVALNQLPTLQQSAVNAWRSLWMRGGLRKKRWRGLRLMLMTVISNALRRAEEIALAAEARAYSPERSRALPVVTGLLDWPIVMIGAVSLVAMILF